MPRFLLFLSATLPGALSFLTVYSASTLPGALSSGLPVLSQLLLAFAVLSGDLFPWPWAPHGCSSFCVGGSLSVVFSRGSCPSSIRHVPGLEPQLRAPFSPLPSAAQLSSLSAGLLVPFSHEDLQIHISSQTSPLNSRLICRTSYPIPPLVFPTHTSNLQCPRPDFCPHACS